MSVRGPSARYAYLLPGMIQVQYCTNSTREECGIDSNSVWVDYCMRWYMSLIQVSLTPTCQSRLSVSHRSLDSEKAEKAVVGHTDLPVACVVLAQQCGMEYKCRYIM